LSISFHFAEKRYPIKFRRRRKEWLIYCISQEGYRVNSIRIIFCSDEFLIKINQEFLKHNYYTDVISFLSGSGRNLTGEIYVSVDRVSENCNIYQVSFNDELNRVLIHGVLHLMNYDDSSKELKSIMTRRENHYLKKF
jgi:probable rRNA maturation factor